MANATRFTFGVTPELAESVRAWGKEHGARTPAEACRMLITVALTQPKDRALAMAYQQALMDLRQVIRESLSRCIDAVTQTVMERKGR
jgi:hypothetical protein